MMIVEIASKERGRGLTSNSETTSGLKNETRARSVITRVNRYHVPLFPPYFPHWPHAFPGPQVRAAKGTRHLASGPHTVFTTW